MSAATLPPPRPAVCLTRSYLSRGVKGGTVIAEDVRSRSEHSRLVVDPDGYRACVSPCRHCASQSLHAHCVRERLLRPARSAASEVERVEIRLYRCFSCRAVFTVLPAFVARHLWRAWKTVETVAKAPWLAARSTSRRWIARLSSDASQLVQLFASSVSSFAQRAVALFSARPSRRRFVDTLAAVYRADGAPLSFTASWVHRLAAGIRLI